MARSGRFLHIKELLVLAVVILEIIGAKPVHGQTTGETVCPSVPSSTLTKLTCQTLDNECNSSAECMDGERCCPIGGQCGVLCRKAVEQTTCPIAIDLAILLDSSESISYREWNRTLQFTADLMDYYDISVNGTRISILTYSSDTDLALSFDTFEGVEINAANVKRKIFGIKQQQRGGGRFIDKALQIANEDIFNVRYKMRMDKKQVCLVVTTGRQTKDQGPFTELQAASAPLKTRGIDVYVLGVGGGIDKTELLDIASTDEFVFTASSHDDLTKISELFGSAQCSGCKKPVDIVFGIPVSRNLGLELAGIKQFFIKMVVLFDVKNTKTHIGAIQYGNTAEMSLHLDKLYDKNRITSFINNIKPSGRQLRVDRAVDTAADYAFTIYGGVRQTAPKVFVLYFPANPASSATANKQAADRLKNLGVRLMIVGLQDNVDRGSLSSLVSQPPRSFLVTSKGFEGFESKRYAMASTVCNIRYGDRCPSQARKPSCPMFVVNECKVDADCKGARLKCCLRGCAKKCVPKVKTCFIPIDVAFIMDNSESVSSEKYDFVKRFVKDVIISYADAENSANFAIGQYAKFFQKGTKTFQNFRSTTELDTVINSLRQRSSSPERNLGTGLRGAANEFFQVKSGMRQGLPRFLIVLASANPTVASERVETAVEDLDKAGVRRIAVGFTDAATPGFLRALASDESLVFRVKEPQLLDTVIAEVRPKLCQEKPGHCPQVRHRDPGQCSSAPVPTGYIPCGESARKTGREQKENDWDCPGEEKCCRHADGCHFVCAAPPLACRNHMEILFLVESSGFVGKNGFRRIKHFVSRLVDMYDISGTTTRVAMVTYSDAAHPIVYFSNTSSWRKEEFKKDVKRAAYLGGRVVKTAKAMRFADRRIFTSRFGSREDIKKTIVLLGSGRFEEAGYAVVIAEKLLGEQINTVAVVIGNQADYSALSRMVVDEKHEVFTVKSETALEGQLRPLVKTICVGGMKEYIVSR